MLPEIWIATDRIFWTVFCPFTHVTTQKIKVLEKWKNAWRYYHFTHVHHKWQSYDVWFLRYEACRTEFFVIFVIIPLTTLKLKNQNLKKLEKMPGDIIILDMSTINDNHMMYGS